MILLQPKSVASASMTKPPPIPEPEFLKLTKNHAEFGTNLTKLGIPNPDLLEYAKHVCSCWFELAEEHLDDAVACYLEGRDRATYSRAYYAAYNASKASRYLVRGYVSLKGDDHKNSAAELPDDLPKVDHWSRQHTLLYEHRLRADYDNWSDTVGSHTITAEDAVNLAGEFLEQIRIYVRDKFGMEL